MQESLLRRNDGLRRFVRHGEYRIEGRRSEGKAESGLAEAVGLAYRCVVLGCARGCYRGLLETESAKSDAQIYSTGKINNLA